MAMGNRLCNAHETVRPWIYWVLHGIHYIHSVLVIAPGLLYWQRVGEIPIEVAHAVSWGCDREPGGIPIAVLLNSRFERKHQRSDSPLGDAVSRGCNWKGHGGHHQGEWHDSWYQGGQGLQQEGHLGNLNGSLGTPRGGHLRLGWFAAKVPAGLQGPHPIKNKQFNHGGAWGMYYWGPNR